LTAIAERVVQAAQRIVWSGTVYRVHGSAWNGDDPGGSLTGSGRWNVGNGDPDQRSAFPVLYTATSALLASWEYIRHSKREDAAAMWQRLRITSTQMAVDLPSTLDLRDPTKVNLPAEIITSDDYGLAQEIAAAAYTAGLSGILAPSATGLGTASGDYNVMVFYEPTGDTLSIYGFPTPMTRPRSGSTVRVLETESPILPP
jgi:RES domain-containing protein